MSDSANRSGKEYRNPDSDQPEASIPRSTLRMRGGAAVYHITQAEISVEQTLIAQNENTVKDQADRTQIFCFIPVFLEQI